MTDFELLLGKVEDLGRVKSGLTTRDRDFVGDMVFAFRQRQFIGRTQAVRIQELWDKHCGPCHGDALARRETTHVRGCGSN